MENPNDAERYGYEGEMTPLKCDELNAYKGDVYIPVYGSIADARVYLKKDVDAAIAELKDVIHELQVDLEGAKATAYADSVDAGMRERRLKRALWIARANRAIEKITWFKLWNASISTMNPEDGARQEFDKWKKALCKFLKKAEEYK